LVLTLNKGLWRGTSHKKISSLLGSKLCQFFKRSAFAVNGFNGVGLKSILLPHRSIVAINRPSFYVERIFYVPVFLYNSCLKKPVGEGVFEARHWPSANRTLDIFWLGFQKNVLG